MSEQIAKPTRGGANPRVIWIGIVLVTLVFLWLVYSATQSSVRTEASSIPGTAGSIATAMPQSMPGMNH